MALGKLGRLYYAADLADLGYSAYAMGTTSQGTNRGISAGSGSIALQGSFQTGLYTKIGDMVYINLWYNILQLT